MSTHLVGVLIKLVVVSSGRANSLSGRVYSPRGTCILHSQALLGGYGSGKLGDDTVPDDNSV